MQQSVDSTLNSVARVAGEMGHELNNELAIVLNYTYVLSRPLEDHPEAREHLDELREAAWRASGLAEHLLTFSHAQRVPPIGTSLQVIIDELEPLLLHGLDPDRQLEVVLEPDLHGVTAARGPIESLMLRAALIKHRNGRELGPLVIGGRNVKLDVTDPSGRVASQQFVRLDIGPLPAETRERRIRDAGSTASTEVQLLTERVRRGLAELGARLEASRDGDALTVTAFLPAAG